MMLSAGIPLLEALDTLVAEAGGGSEQCGQKSRSGIGAWFRSGDGFRSAVRQVREDVAGGSSLADALARRPDVFDAASVQMVAVGEDGGTLDEVLGQLSGFKRRQLATRDRVATALVYPIFLTAFAAAAAVFLMTSVLPPLLSTLEEMSELQWPTRVVRTISEALLRHGGKAALAGLGCIGLFVLWSRSARGRSVVDRWVLRLPILGPMTLKQHTSRIAMVVGTLVRSGVELDRALELAAATTGNSVIAGAVRGVRARIAAGADAADAIAEADVLPPLAARVFAVGQDSGRLDELLLQLAEDYDDQVAALSTRLTSLIEPVLILVLALGIGFLLLATVLPILEAGAAVGA